MVCEISQEDEISKLDKFKEELNYLKVWLAEHLGSNVKSYLAISFVAALSVAIVPTHRKIISKTEEAVV